MVDVQAFPVSCSKVASFTGEVDASSASVFSWERNPR
jgi:hypothetical protein